MIGKFTKFTHAKNVQSPILPGPWNLISKLIEITHTLNTLVKSETHQKLFTTVKIINDIKHKKNYKKKKVRMKGRFNMCEKNAIQALFGNMNYIFEIIV